MKGPYSFLLLVKLKFEMGEIIKTKAVGNKIIYKIELSEEETLQLKNHVTKIHMFSIDLCCYNSKIIERGSNGRAKYFTIPLNLKSRKKKRFNKVSYHKITNKDKTFFIYVVDKDLLF